MSKKKRVDKPHIRYVNMGPWPCYVGITTSADNFATEMKRLGVDGVEFLGHANANATLHTLVNRGSLCCILAIQPFKPKQRTKEAYAALVAHEAVHVVQAMRDELSRGAELGAEAEAYIVQHIVQEALQLAFGSSMVRRTEPV